MDQPIQTPAFRAFRAITESEHRLDDALRDFPSDRDLTAASDDDAAELRAAVADLERAASRVRHVADRVTDYGRIGPTASDGSG